MDAIGLLVLLLSPVLVLIAACLWRIGREQCPEREPDMSDEERDYLRKWAKTNRW